MDAFTKDSTCLSSEASRGGVVCSSEGKSRGARDTVAVEGRRRDHQVTCDGRRKCSTRNHPTHGFRKSKTLEYELGVGPRKRNIK